ncbi:MAG: hypothetical protein AAF479_03815, partial [Pseudomonadota bacterium]
SDGEARANAAMLATEMFNISLSAVGKSTEENPIRFTIKHRRGRCTIAMHDTCELIASARIDRIRQIAYNETMFAPPLEDGDLALMMIMQVSEKFEQIEADYGRIIQAEITTPIHDADDAIQTKPVN